MSRTDPPSRPPRALTWWRRRSVKLRIALSFSVIACTLLLGRLPFVYHQTDKRLSLELDRELGIDWVLIEAHLELDESGGVRWKKSSPSTLEKGGYAASWFDVWAGPDRLMSHCPPGGMEVTIPPRPVDAGGEPTDIRNLAIGDGLAVRVLQKPTRIGGRDLTLRVFRDRSALEETLRQLVWTIALGVPVAILLAAAGGYFMAAHTLRPVVEMTEQARRIHSESLGRRLPNPNPHDEVGRLATVFNETLGRLENSFDSLRRFTADASHELRTPLTALRSVGEIALREADDVETLRDTIGSMLEEAQRLQDLTDTLLALARVENSRPIPALEKVSLGPLVGEVCDSLEVLASEKRQRLEIAAPDLTAPADPVLLRQAVMNLVHNAIRYSEPGTTIRVHTGIEDGAAYIEVADEGPGIAPEHQQRVFERFYRVDKARTRAEGGTGLGLALAALAVERIGGSIDLNSEVGKGSRFRIRLPLATSAEAPAAGRS